MKQCLCWLYNCLEFGLTIYCKKHFECFPLCSALLCFTHKTTGNCICIRKIHSHGAHNEITITLALATNEWQAAVAVTVAVLVLRRRRVCENNFSVSVRSREQCQSACPAVYPYAGLGVASTSSSSSSRGSSSLCISHICLVWDLQQLRRMTMTEVCACKS